MSTSGHDDATSAPDERPRPRYGAYAPKPTGEETAKEPAADSAERENTEERAEQPAEQRSPAASPWASPEPAKSSEAQVASPYGTPTEEELRAAEGGPAPFPQGSGEQPAQTPPSRPGSLYATLILLLVAGLTSLAWGIYVFATLPGQHPDEVLSPYMQESMLAATQNDPQLSDMTQAEILEFTVITFALVALIWSIILLGLYITMAFLGSMAGTPGRVLATIWSGLSLFFLLLGHNGTSYALIFLVVLLSAAAIVTMWLPPSNHFVRHRRWWKEARRRRGY